MEKFNIYGRTCHAVINGADLPTVYLGEMKNRSETIEKVLFLRRCEMQLHRLRIR